MKFNGVREPAPDTLGLGIPDPRVMMGRRVGVGGVRRALRLVAHTRRQGLGQLIRPPRQAVAEGLRHLADAAVLDKGAYSNDPSAMPGSEAMFCFIQGMVPLNQLSPLVQPTRRPGR